MGDGIRSERLGIIPRSGIWARAVPKTQPTQAALASERRAVAESRDEKRLDRVHAVLGLVEDLGVL